MYRYDILKSPLNQSDGVARTDLVGEQRWFSSAQLASPIVPAVSDNNNPRATDYPYSDFLVHSETGTTITVTEHSYIVSRGDGQGAYLVNNFTRENVVRFAFTCVTEWTKGRFIIAAQGMLATTSISGIAWETANNTNADTEVCTLFLIVVDPHFDRKATTTGDKSPHQYIELYPSWKGAVNIGALPAIISMAAKPLPAELNPGWASLGMVIRSKTRAFQANATAEVTVWGYRAAVANYYLVVRIPEVFSHYTSSSIQEDTRRYGFTNTTNAEHFAVSNFFRMTDYGGERCVYHLSGLPYTSTSKERPGSIPTRRMPVFLGKNASRSYTTNENIISTVADTPGFFNGFYQFGTTDAQAFWFISQPIGTSNGNKVFSPLRAQAVTAGVVSGQLSATWASTLLSSEATSTGPSNVRVRATLAPAGAFLANTSYTGNVKIIFSYRSQLETPSRVGFSAPTSLYVVSGSGPLTLAERKTVTGVSVNNYYRDILPSRQATTLFGIEHFSYNSGMNYGCNTSFGSVRGDPGIARDVLNLNVTVLWSETQVQGPDSVLPITNGSLSFEGNSYLSFSSYRSAFIFEPSNGQLCLALAWIHQLQHDQPGGVSEEWMVVADKSGTMNVTNEGLRTGINYPRFCRYSINMSDIFATYKNEIVDGYANPGMRTLDLTNTISPRYNYAVEITYSPRNINFQSGKSMANLLMVNWEGTGQMTHYQITVDSNVSALHMRLDPRPGLTLGLLVAFHRANGKFVQFRIPLSDVPLVGTNLTGEQGTYLKLVDGIAVKIESTVIDPSGTTPGPVDRINNGYSPLFNLAQVSTDSKAQGYDGMFTMNGMSMIMPRNKVLGGVGARLSNKVTGGLTFTYSGVPVDLTNPISDLRKPLT